MARTVMFWRIEINWAGDTEEVAETRMRQLEDFLTSKEFGKGCPSVRWPEDDENTINQYPEGYSVKATLACRAMCLDCDSIGESPDTINHRSFCL